MTKLVLLTQTRDEGMPRVLFTGEGACTVEVQTLSITASYSGSGTLTSAMNDYAAPAPFTGDGSLGASGYRNVVPEMRLLVLDPSLIQAPTALTVSLVDAKASTDVTFKIDGVVVYTATADSDGYLEPTSIPVSEAVGAVGSHTVTAEQTGSQTASGTFTIDKPPSLAPRNIGPDAQAVDIPAADTATGVRRWVLQDLMPGGLGSYVLPLNPTSMSHPHRERALEPMHSTAVSGQFHIFEGGPVPTEWTFSGYCPNQAMHDQLLAYGNLKRRFYVIDHRKRAWVVTFLNVDLVARRRQNEGGTFNDWAHDYTISALVYNQNAVVPA